jgi:hypothetical protein
MTTKPPVRSLVRQEIQRIAERFEQAERRVKEVRRIAATKPDEETCKDALAELDDALGEFRASGEELADLLLLGFRYARDYRPDALRQIMVDALRPELEAITDALARLEARR